MRSDWFPCRSRTFASPIHRGGTLNGSSRHWMGNVSSSEQGSFSIPNGSLLLSGLGQGPSGRAIRTHDLEQTLRARFGRPLPDVSGTGARGRRTQRVVFPLYAHLPASPQGLWDLSCWGDFRVDRDRRRPALSERLPGGGGGDQQQRQRELHLI